MHTALLFVIFIITAAFLNIADI